MQLDPLKIARIRVLNEIAFIMGDNAHGGPNRQKELTSLRHELHQLSEQLALHSLLHFEESNAI